METDKKNKALASLAGLICQHKTEIIAENKKDIESCGGIDASLLDRLKVDEKKVLGMVSSIEQVMSATDPEGKVLDKYDHPNGLKIENRAVPFGLILIIYESRPDVTIEAAIIAFKAGNKILLKGGKEARNTNLCLVRLWHEALSKNGLNENLVTYLDLSRAETQDLIRYNVMKIDLIIPRGGDGLINFVTSHTNVPVIVSGRGNNFLYVDDEADFDMALNIILNGKSRLSVCNALDKVLLNDSMEGLADKLNTLVNALTGMGISVYADNYLRQLNSSILKPESPRMMEEEFLSAKIFLAEIKDLDEAIETINKYSGKHSATIVTTNKQRALKFMEEVDCAAVYHNASTRFTDGGEFGFGAEIAISTQKLHFRGPVGLDQLVTNKWFIEGTGQTRE